MHTQRQRCLLASLKAAYAGRQAGRRLPNRAPPPSPPPHSLALLEPLPLLHQVEEADRLRGRLSRGYGGYAWSSILNQSPDSQSSAITPTKEEEEKKK